jgi:uncharacterized protein
VCPHAKAFITPMAAVAGSVADEIMAAMVAGRTLQKAYVNNGGDSALHLADGRSMTIAIAGTGYGFSDRVTIRAEDPVRGVATSGWRGRSHSLGIADAVTVLAKDAAAADAAATIIANAVNLPRHPAVERAPASSLQPDSDLGERPVTVGVGALSSADVAAALDAGLAVAEDCRMRGLIHAAALFLGGETQVCGALAGMDSAHNLTKEPPLRLAPLGTSPSFHGGEEPEPAKVSASSPVRSGGEVPRSEAERGHKVRRQKAIS